MTETTANTNYDEREVQSWLTDDDSLVRAIREVTGNISDNKLATIIGDLAVEFGHFDKALNAIRSGWLRMH